jgi:hypothetical protein
VSFGTIIALLVGPQPVTHRCNDFTIPPVAPFGKYRLPLLLFLQAGAIEDDLDNLLHKRLNAGLSTFCIAQALLLVSCRFFVGSKARSHHSVLLVSLY